ncbi:unnamed protein product [Blepharisma stoltei]|uniref:Uncharacterized protein n=1 Tax=Blepharisma stoltei TaxID=1481888 RepID=A0AAU9J0S0_9CILI|nr:unnamed protein product [Blepharisma stoltei]
MEGNSEFTNIKLIIIGASGVGKTALIHKLTGNEDIFPTVGLEYTPFQVKMNNEKTICFQIWDMSGNEKYKDITTPLLKRPDFCLLVLDLSSRKSFEELDRWYNLLKENSEGNFTSYLLGNKADLEREISEEEINEWARPRNIEYFETSAIWKKNKSEEFQLGIEPIFQKIGQNCPKNNTYNGLPLKIIRPLKTLHPRKHNCFCC